MIKSESLKVEPGIVWLKVSEGFTVDSHTGWPVAGSSSNVIVYMTHLVALVQMWVLIQEIEGEACSCYIQTEEPLAVQEALHEGRQVWAGRGRLHKI